MRCLRTGVIQGDLEDQARLVRKGACLSTTSLQLAFQACPMWFGLSQVFYELPILWIDTIRKTIRVKGFEMSVSNSRMTFTTQPT